MPIDSTANLLFKIGANSDDAEANIQRFRSILSKDLGDLGGEFSDWANKTFGDLSTVQGALTALTATVGAGVIALGGAMLESASHYAEYVEEVDRGSRATGISTENMSGLKLMAQETSTSYDSLVTGLTRFAVTIVKANEGGEQQTRAFQRLGISQAQVKAGEKDMLPLLEAVADRFKGLGSQVDKTAIARDLFSKSGPALVKMLSLGTEGIKEFEQHAAELGYTVGDKDVAAMEVFKATIAEGKAELSAISMVIGRDLIGSVSHALQLLVRMGIELRDLPHLLKGDFWATFKKDVEETERHIQSLAAAEAKMADAAGKGMDGGTTQKLKENFTGLSDLLAEVNEKFEGLGGEQGKLQAQFEGLDQKLAKAYDAYLKLHAAGELSIEDAKEQAAALKLLPDALKALEAALQGEADTKQAEAVRRAGEELQELVLRQGEQTIDIKNRLLDLDVAKRREAMQKEHTDTAENLAWLAAYEAAERQKIGAEKIAQIEKEGEKIDGLVRAQGERTYDQKVADWNRQMDEELREDAKEGEGVANHEAQIAALRKAGLDKIAADAKAAGDSEIARLDEQLERINREHQTSEERIEAQYTADVAKFSAAEEKKTLKLATSEAQRAQIMQMFEAIRKGLTDKEQADLQTLRNSQGWQGVFGSKFGEMLKGNEAASKEWASSTNQSLLMVKDSLQVLDQMAKQAFQQFAQGMGQNIAHAIMYKQSIGDAMKAALAATLESLAGQAYTQAIYSLALGFLDLAEGNEAGAVQAFTAAAIFGTVGTGAALIGRSVAPAQGGSGAGSSSPSTSSQMSAQQKDMQYGAVGAPSGGGGPHVTVNVWGHVWGTSGVSEVCSMINDAVVNSNCTLTATNTKTGTQTQQ